MEQRTEKSKIAHVHKQTVTEMSEMSKSEREAAMNKLGIGNGETEPAEMKIPNPLSHFPKETKIYKLFNKKYWKGRVLQFDPKQHYYTVQYDDNDEEELTHAEVKAYLIPPKRGEYWTAQQSGRQRSKRIEKVSFTIGYAGAARALAHTPT